MNWTNSHDNLNSHASRADTPRPTLADERSATADDGQVIERTLPAQAAGVKARMRSGVERVAGATRGYVSQSPLSATMMAAAGGAAVTALLLLAGTRLLPQPSPVYAGLRRIKAAIR